MAPSETKLRSFTGSLVALVTPFAEGAVDFESVEKLLAFHKDAGTHGVILAGTTGESSTLTFEEKIGLFQKGKGFAGPDLPIIGGVGSSSTAETVALAREACKTGIDGLLVVTPQYNKPTQEGLYRHFMAVADAVDLPVILYNVPGRTGVNMLPPTVERLSPHPNIVAVKEASGNLNQVIDIIRRCHHTCSVLSGDDAMTLPIMAAGGTGVISVVANIIPHTMAALVKAIQERDMKRAAALSQNMLPLCDAMFWESNPIPVKTALHKMGWCRLEFRLPMCPASAEVDEKLQRILGEYQLLPER